MKALAQIHFEISCTQDFQDFFSKGDNSERGHNSEKKKNTGHLFFHEESKILFEISCTQDFFSKGDNSKRGHNSEKEKNTGHLFFL